MHMQPSTISVKPQSPNFYISADCPTRLRKDMSTLTCVSCQDVLSCGDSPLSITGNVIGILTFVGAILISTQVYLNSIRNADRNIFEMTNKLQSRMDEAMHLRRRLLGLEDKLGGNAGLAARLYVAIDRVQDPLGQADALLGRLNIGRYDKIKLLTRTKFVFREELIKQGLEKTEKAMETLREVANDVFSQVASPLDDHLLEFRTEVLKELGQMKNEIKALKEVSPPVGHEVAFQSEVLQDQVEMRNEMKNLKETNTKMMYEVRDLLGARKNSDQDAT
ncbi:hypothetical protein BDZ45DRAFT_754427 [Acephala macrosclerotiorum]|nr:hypothetical protein BDZ45DRAFT_754427 [Acephala macrosclerotiorum]